MSSYVTDALALAVVCAALWAMLWLAPGLDAAVIEWRASR